MRPVALAFVLALVMPASALGHGSRVTGTLVERHGHESDGTMVEKSFAIHTGSAVRQLSGAQPETLIGQRVVAEDASSMPGVQGTARASGEQRLAALAAPGPRSLLVILVSFPGLPSPYTHEGALAAVFTGPQSSNALLSQQSAGAGGFVGLVSPEGDVTAPMQVNVSTSGCEDYTIASQADAAARLAGWPVGNYDHGSMPCRRSGARSDLRICPAHAPGWRTCNADRRAQLGHNLGAHHANSYRCTDAGGVPVTLSDQCISVEYRDPFTIMGVPARLMASWHRAQVGHLPDGQEPCSRRRRRSSLSRRTTSRPARARGWC